MVSWNRSKIMLVGQGRAGKTALARSMMVEPFRETPSTIGGEGDQRRECEKRETSRTQKTRERTGMDDRQEWDEI
jgi:GTPase SAR1 family protein